MAYYYQLIIKDIERKLGSVLTTWTHQGQAKQVYCQELDRFAHKERVVATSFLEFPFVSEVMVKGRGTPLGVVLVIVVGTADTTLILRKASSCFLRTETYRFLFLKNRNRQLFLNKNSSYKMGVGERKMAVVVPTDVTQEHPSRSYAHGKTWSRWGFCRGSMCSLEVLSSQNLHLFNNPDDLRTSFFRGFMRFHRHD